MDEHTSRDDERERMLRLKAGDPEAFSELFSRYQPAITSYVYRLSGGNVTQAEDISQQVFLSFWLHRADYDLEKPLAPLLLLSCGGIGSHRLLPFVLRNPPCLNILSRFFLRVAHRVPLS